METTVSRTIPNHHDYDGELFKGHQYVRIRYICEKCKRGDRSVVIGVFGMDTYEGCSRRAWMEPLRRNQLPADSKYPGKVQLLCSCGHKPRTSEANITAALNKIWKPGIHWSVEQRI